MIWFLKKREKDYVMVMRADGSWDKCQVAWEGGWPYCERHKDWFRLKPGGEFEGMSKNSWLVRWEPATDGMRWFYDSAKQQEEA